MKIVEHILNNVAQRSRISPVGDLLDYFSNFPLKVSWPFADIDEDTKDEYITAKVNSDKFGFSQGLQLNARFITSNCSYTLSEKIWNYEDGLEVEIGSILRQELFPKQRDNFVYGLIKKHYEFIKKSAEEMGIAPEDSMLKIHAHSGIIDHVKTRGAYVWANYGFDFASKEELENARRSFKKFAKKHAVTITDKDLNYFKFPCHFAVFKTSSDEKGKELGKQFLLQYEWWGKMTAELDEESELFRYQKAYHEKGKDSAIQELSKAFLCVVNKYNYKPKPNLWNIIIEKKNKLFSH